MSVTSVTSVTSVKSAFVMVVFQVIIIDIVFSVDSIITAVGMAEDISVIIAAVMIAVGVMYLASGPVSDFISRHPTTKMLALALPYPHRCCPGGRWFRRSHPARLRLFVDGVCGCCGILQCRSLAPQKGA